MEILKVNPDNPEPAVIAKAVEVIRSGGVVIYPTDTCYGIGGDATAPSVIDKIKAMKGRPAHKPFSVIMRDRNMINSFAIIDSEIEKILAHYLPGPYTFALLTKNLRKWPYNSIWIRMPRFEVTRTIAECLPMPYLTTSANLSGEPPAYSVEELNDTLLNPELVTIIPDLVLDAGPLPKNPPSTIVDLTVLPPKIIREGGATFTWPITN